MEPKTNKTTKINWLQYLKNPNYYFGASALSFILIALILILPKYNKLVELKTSIKALDIEIYGDPQNNAYLSKNAELQQKEYEYNEEKKKFDQASEEKNKYLEKVFPVGDDTDIKQITQILETYAIEHNSEKHPFVLNSINFGKISTQKASKSTPTTPPAKIPYQTISINFPLEASEKNFTDFVKFLQNSGSINPDEFYQEKHPVPLLSIDSLTFSYKEHPNYPSIQLVNANFILNTYIRLNTLNNVSSTK